MGIGSAAIMFNVDFVLDELQIREYFSAIVSANEVKKSKPDPETFLTCALNLDANPENCIVFEDAPKGVEAAAHAGMKSVVLTTMHEENEFQKFDNILLFAPDFRNINVSDLLNK